MTTTRRPFSRGALGLAAAALTLAACSTGPEPASGAASSAAASAATSAAPSLSPSSPPEMSTGMSMTTSVSTSAAPSGSAAADAATHNDTDVTFLQMMLPHHRGAVAMAQLAPSRAANAQIKELAAQIEAAQAPEIEQMTSLLQAWSAPVESTAVMTDMGGMDHGGMTMGKDGGMESSTGGAMAMPGEMSQEQMTALQASTGAEFDRMFLELMIEHHTGAVEMAQIELDGGVNTEALQLAESIQVGQTEEITTMQQLLQTP